MKKLIASFVLVLLGISRFSLFAYELSIEDQIIFEKFFRTFFEHSEGGYVLYGKKPVCINGYHAEEHFFPGSPRYEHMVYFKEGMRLWRTIDLPKNNTFILHDYDINDSLAKFYIHLLFIHREHFLKTVQENISLFQYVLGPELTPELLLQKLTDPKIPFHTTLKNDKVLIGIILGFGTQNSLFGSRYENIQDMLFGTESPPLKPILERFGPVQKMFKDILLFTDHPNISVDFSLIPSFGFDTIPEEMRLLTSKLEISSEKLTRNTPPFFFTKIRNDNKIDPFIVDLEMTQDKINQLLQSENFLSEILNTILDSEVKVHQQSDLPKHPLLAFDFEEVNSLPFIVGKYIWDSIKDEEETFIDAFKTGMLEANNGRLMQSCTTDHNVYLKSKVLSQVKANLKQVDAIFSDLQKNDQYACQVPDKLYYKISKNGHGPILIGNHKVLIHYTILAGPENSLLSDTRTKGVPSKVNLSETIPGFAHGIQGMKVGEEREIYIHPSLAYGIYTTIEKGQYLKVSVQLLDIHANETTAKLPKIQALDLENEIPSNIEDTYLNHQKEIGYLLGYQTWSHYRKSEHYTLDQVLNWMLKNDEQIAAMPSTVDPEKVINRLHWNLYQMKD